MITRIQKNLINAVMAIDELQDSLIEYAKSNTVTTTVMATGIKATDIGNFKKKKGREYSFKWMEKFAENIIRWESKK